MRQLRLALWTVPVALLIAACAPGAPGVPTLATVPAEPVATTLLAPPSTMVASGGAYLLRLDDNLDDPQGYCIDVAGFGSSLQLDAPLQAHTCKPGSDDQLFTAIDSDGLLLTEYDRCLAAAMPEAGAAVIVAACDSSARGQGLRFDSIGRVYLAPERGPELCVGVSPDAGEPAGGRNHLRRDLALYDCAAVDPVLITWAMANR